MNTRGKLFGGTASAAAAVAAMLSASATVLASNDFLSFADLDGIRDFRPDGDGAMYIEGRNRQWYRATFLSPCYELRFTDRVGFVIEPTGRLDKFSSIIVGGQRCYFSTFEKVDGDPAKP